MTEEAVEQRDPMVVMLLINPPWGPLLRSSVSWPKLAKTMEFRRPVIST